MCDTFTYALGRSTAGRLSFEARRERCLRTLYSGSYLSHMTCFICEHESLLSFLQKALSSFRPEISASGVTFRLSIDSKARAWKSGRVTNTSSEAEIVFAIS